MQNGVGPVIQCGITGSSILAAISELNPAAELIDRGAYVRVLAPERCLLTREAAERHGGQEFIFPGDLEKIMSAFKGKLRISATEAVWSVQ